MYSDTGASERIRAIGAMLTPRQLSLTFELVDSRHINAYARGRVISVTMGAYLLAADDDGIAGLLGHEIAHLMLGQRGPESEFEADKLGVKLAAEAGFHPQGLRRFLKAFVQILADFPEAAPPSAQHILNARIERL